MRTLAERCARAIPTLRYFVLSDDGPTYEQFEWDKEELRQVAEVDEEHLEGMLRSQDASRAEDFCEMTHASELDECCFYRRTSSHGWRETLQSWRVVRDDVEGGGERGGCRMELLTHDEAKRLHKTLVSSFDGKNLPLTGTKLPFALSASLADDIRVRDIHHPCLESNREYG